MSKNSKGGLMVAPMAPMAPMTADWFESLDPKAFWRGLMPDSIKVEEFRDGDTMVVRAEVPGLDPDQDIDVTVTDDVLRMKVERSERKEDRDKDQYRSEFRYGSFTRSVHLPPGADADDVVATYKNGILEVRMPVDETKAPHKVQITH